MDGLGSQFMVRCNAFDHNHFREDIKDIKSLLSQLSRSGAPHPTIDHLERIADAGYLFLMRGPGMRYDGMRKIIGMATLCVVTTLCDEFGWIHDVVVDEAWRGEREIEPGAPMKSAAQLLMEVAIDHAAHPGAIRRVKRPALSHVDLTSHPERERANALYSRKFGFVKVPSKDAGLYSPPKGLPPEILPADAEFDISRMFSYHDVPSIRAVLKESGMPSDTDFKRIERAYGPHRVPFFARPAKSRIHAGEIVGLGSTNVMVAPAGMIALVSDIAMREKYAESGLAGMLVFHGVRVAKAMGAGRVMIRCGSGWFAEHKLDDLGFTRIETNYYTKILSQPVLRV